MTKLENNSTSIDATNIPETPKLGVVELFSGIGSYAEALRKNQVQHELRGILEINRYAIEAYKHLHGNIPNFGDISGVDRLPLADLWCYSAPCTDISLAGQMRGMERGSNTASSLLWEVERLLDTAKEHDELPKYLLMENVPMLVSKKFIHSFNEWLEVLEKLGYKNYWKLLNAKDYGIPQNRNRVFLISILNPKHEFEFPKVFPLWKKLLDYLEPVVDDKYFISEAFLLYATDPTDRNGFIRANRFRPHDAENSKYAYTITTRKGSTPTDNFILVPEATIRGYKEAHLGDGIYINRPHQKRGTVQKGKIQTIKRTVNDLGVIVERDKALMIRKITPRESLRLMGWSDERINVIIDKFSDARLYTFAGNAVVIDVLCEIFKELFKYGI